MNFDTSISRRVRVECHQDARVVSLHGEHDVSTAPLVRERLAEARSASGLIVVDMTAATFVDTTLAMTLVEAFRADTPPRLRFVMPADTFPRRAFFRMGVGTWLPIYDRLDDALTDQTARSPSN
jgi:anti-sigma B factor antagonist